MGVIPKNFSKIFDNIFSQRIIEKSNTFQVLLNIYLRALKNSLSFGPFFCCTSGCCIGTLEV